METVREEFEIGCRVPGAMPSSAQSIPAQPDLAAVLQGLVDDQVREQDILGMAVAVRAFDGTVVGAGSGVADSTDEVVWTVD